MATFNHFHRAPSFNPSRLVFYYISTHFSGHLSNAPSVLRFCAFNMPVLNGHFVCYIVCHIIDGMGPRIERSQNKSQALTADNWQIIELEIWFLLKKITDFNTCFVFLCINLYTYFIAKFGNGQSCVEKLSKALYRKTLLLFVYRI